MVDQLELSLKDLFLKILLKWRLILVCMVAVGMMFGLLGAYKNSLLNASHAAPETHDEESLETQAEYYKNWLSQAESEHVEIAVETYYSYIQQANTMYDYINESIFMKLKAYEVPTMQKMYQVTVANSDSQNSNTIARAYVWELDSTDVYEAIAEELEEISTVRCAKELVKFSDVQDGTFSVTIIATDKEQCEQIFEIVDGRIAKFHSSLKKAYGDFTFLDLNEKFSYQADPDMITKQQKVQDTYLALEGYKNALDDNFSEDQYAYYNTLIALQADEAVEEEVVEEVPVTISLINKKYILVGLVLGIMAGCGLAAVMYVFSSKLRKTDDMEIVYGIPTLAAIKTQSSKKKILGCIDKVIYRIFNGKNNAENEVEDICINIKMIAKKNNATKIYLVSSSKNDSIATLQQSICEKLSSEFEVKSGELVLEDMLNAELLIQFEQTGVSKNENIQRIIDLAKIHSIQIGGSVIFETY